MNEVWGRCAEEVSLDLTGSFWTNLLPRVKNEATIKVFASQASEESDWETTAYGLSKRLVSRSRYPCASLIQRRTNAKRGSGLFLHLCVHFGGLRILVAARPGLEGRRHCGWRPALIRARPGSACRARSCPQAASPGRLPLRPRRKACGGSRRSACREAPHCAPPRGSIPRHRGSLRC